MSAILTEGDALLADIARHPDDDALRLIYADWCQDHGQPERAEFIRVQLERRATPEPAPHACRQGDDDHSECQACAPLVRLRGRERELLSDHAHVWFRDAFPWLPDRPAEAHFAQWWSWLAGGFVERVRLPLAAWLEHGPALVRQHPLMRVELSDRVPTGSDPGGKAGWFVRAGSELPYSLPAAIWSRLRCRGERCNCGRNCGERWKLFKSPGKAHDALSAACLAWARRGNKPPRSSP